MSSTIITKAYALDTAKTLGQMLTRLDANPGDLASQATTADTLVRVTCDVLEAAGLGEWAEDLVTVWTANASTTEVDRGPSYSPRRVQEPRVDLDGLRGGLARMVADLDEYLTNEDEAKIAADEEAASLADLLTPDPWGNAAPTTAESIAMAEPLEVRDQDGRVILPGYIVASQAEDMAGQVVRVFYGQIDGPAEFHTAMVEVIPDGGGQSYRLAAEETLIVWTHAPLATATPAYQPLGDRDYWCADYPTTVTRRPDDTAVPTVGGDEVYQMGHWEQMVTGIALTNLAEVTRLVNPDTALAITALARIWATPQTTTTVVVNHTDE